MILKLIESIGLKNSIQLIKYKSLLMSLALLLVLASATLGQEVEWVRQFRGTGSAEDLAEAFDTNGNINSG